MERSTYHHGDLAAALRTAGLELLEAGGADRLSLRAVARAAGVSPNAPYRHYADKDDLLAALAADGCADLRGRIEGLTGETLRDRLVAVVREGVRFARERPQAFRLMTGHVCSSRPVAAAAMNEVRSATVTVLRGSGEKATEGRGPGEDALVVGVMALTSGLSALLVDGTVHPAPGETDDAFVERVVRATIA
ncbi:TetR/AcrR family transcriptional regulator [Catenuloplanes japonicus]|uniref:TetR/AcrR family transcriptional regulator n=1 Tax=Catenuloplanes japonicus TaxID=33876 RepID=UPI0005253E70|nr:TetR/AcrR family transcriptional regulator [Catenuloplanes japonicus]